MSLDGLEGLEEIGGSVTIVGGNPGLCSLRGLDFVTAIDGDLTIGANTSLTSLDGLDRLTSLTGTLEVGGNTLLPMCEVRALVERLREHGWTGVADIDGNCYTCACE